MSGSPFSMTETKVILLHILVILLLCVHTISLPARQMGPRNSNDCITEQRKKIDLRELRMEAINAITRLMMMSTCGYMLYDTSAILHGEAAPDHWWPWQAFLQGKGFSCGAILISDLWVLSAAHCQGDLEFVLLGSKSIQNMTRNPYAQIINVSEEIAHEDFSLETFRNDIMLLKLEKKAVFTDFVSPACLPKADQIFNGSDVCYTTGWGVYNTDGKSAPDLLQQIKVRVELDYVCREAWGPDAPSPGSKQLCIRQWADTETGPCHGDSGGPLSCKQNDIYYAAGILSFGSGVPKSNTCKGTRPDVYIKVSAYLDWIYDKMQKY